GTVSVDIVGAGRVVVVDEDVLVVEDGGGAGGTKQDASKTAQTAATNPLEIRLDTITRLPAKGTTLDPDQSATRTCAPPHRLASYMAASAANSNRSPDGPSPSATPTLARTSNVSPSTSTDLLAASISRCANSSTSARLAARHTTANSSPPTRATVARSPTAD